MKKIYVGNISYNVSEADVSELFAQYGTVHSIKLITDHVTGRYRGFGFVEMDPDEAYVAILCTGIN